MKKLLLICVFYFSLQTAFAQMDSRFYFPDKEWRGIDESLDYREYYMPASGQDTIHSVLFLSTLPAKATVIYFHGNSANISKTVPCIIPLITSGYQVWMMDYRGYGKSTGTPTHVSNAADAQLFFDAAMAEKTVKDKPVILYGQSIGAQVATHIARNNTGVAALVLDGMAPSFTDLALCLHRRRNITILSGNT